MPAIVRDKKSAGNNHKNYPIEPLKGWQTGDRHGKTVNFRKVFQPRQDLQKLLEKKQAGGV